MAHPLLKDVYRLTNRPDLAMATEHALASVIREVHNRDDFARDLLEVHLETLTNNDVTTAYLPPQTRKVAHVRTHPTSDVMPGPYLTPITGGQAVTTARYRQSDCFYVVGTTLHARITTPTDRLLVGLYMFPAFDASDWAVQLYPHVIVDGTVARMFQRMGDPQWQSYAQSYAQGLDHLWRNELYPQGLEVEPR